MTNEAFPKTIELPDNSSVELRRMSSADRDALLAFARALPEEDLLFLRVDLTEERVVDDWLANADSGRSTGIVAYDDNGLNGYAVVHTNPTSWHRHLGEIRVNVNPAYRNRGLGRALIGNVFELAGTMGLQKLTAHMTADQRGAQAAFRHVGFVPEAHLADYVQDRTGTTRDMIIMSFDIDGLTDQAVSAIRV